MYACIICRHYAWVGCDIVGYCNDCLSGTLMYKKQASVFIQKPNKNRTIKNILEGNVNYTLSIKFWG